jgi:N-acetylglutamate synthase
MILSLEELALNAWPALQTMLYDGWVMRFSKGYTRRANSVSPLYASTKDTAEKIRVCEQAYQAQGLPVIFKLTAASCPPDLDARLAERGYQPDAYTSVQLLDLSRGEPAADAGVTLAPVETEEWQTAFARMSKVGAERQATHRQLLDAILPAKCFASLSQDGQVVACGLAVAQAGYVGLFDIVVDARCRRQGHGERLVRSLLAWGRQRGAHTSYLQVMLNNAPALQLYAKVGYREVYQYWYRVLKHPE